MTMPSNLKLIHEKALTLSQIYKKSEADLLDVIIEVRNHKIYRYFECTSIFEYCVKILKLDPGIVYGLTAVAKKIAEVPELKEKIKEGTFNVSTARRITSVLTAENKTEWFEKAESLTQKKLEREVAKVNPKAEVKEKASYLSSKRVRLELGLDEKEMLKLRRIQDLESQKRQHSVSLEEVLKVMAEVYLTKHDPVEKAKRAEVRRRDQKSTPYQTCEPKTQTPLTLQEINFSARINSRRTRIPSQKLHQVHLRDKGQCQHMNSHTHERCRNMRFIEIHHKVPLSRGGGHELQNLITLCSEHHKIEHNEASMG